MFSRNFLIFLFQKGLFFTSFFPNIGNAKSKINKKVWFLKLVDNFLSCNFQPSQLEQLKLIKSLIDKTDVPFMREHYRLHVCQKNRRIKSPENLINFNLKQDRYSKGIYLYKVWFFIHSKKNLQQYMKTFIRKATHSLG